MTKDLTEQWKNGELEEGFYYLKDNEYIFIDHFNGVSFEETCDFEIKEVLAPVPSYEKYISLVNWKEDLMDLCTAKERIIEKYENIDTWWKAEYDELKEENAKLKELLKECKEVIETSVWGNCSELTDQIDEVLK
jgi:hypothetical protein